MQQPDGHPMSHDQNFKNLILDYPRAAIALFAAVEAQVIDARAPPTHPREATPGAPAGRALWPRRSRHQIDRHPPAMVTCARVQALNV